MGLLETMSRWKGEPSRACRPFDRRRDGWVPGEGAGIVILEEREHALQRGARIHGEILGGGSGCDAMPGGGLDPEGGGTEVAITAALEEAGLEPSEIGHVNAHGSATRGLRPGRGTGLPADLRRQAACPSRPSRVTWATWPPAAAPSS